MNKNTKAWKLVEELSKVYNIIRVSIQEDELYITTYNSRTLFHVKHFHYDYGSGMYIEIIDKPIDFYS